MQLIQTNLYCRVDLSSILDLNAYEGINQQRYEFVYSKLYVLLNILINCAV